MTIDVVARAHPRSRTALFRGVSAAALVSSSRSPQIRALHSAPWSSSYLNTDRSRRRHRSLHYRFMESLNRKLSWDNGSRSHEDRIAMKRAMAHAMSDKQSAAAKYTNADQVQSWSDDVSGLRPGRSIEDAERDAINHLFRSHARASYEHDLWTSPLQNIQNYLSSQHAPKDVSPDDVINATADTHDTAAASASQASSKSNKAPRSATSRRRNLRRATSTATPTPASPHAPASYTPKYEDLDRFGSQPSSITEDYGPTLWNEPDGLVPPTAEEKSKQYHDLGSYQPVTWNEPDGLPQKTAEELSKNYSDLDKYKPVSWNEPHGLQPKTAEELSKNYDDLAKYGAVHWNEPDGLPAKSAEELSKNYDDLDKYSAVRWHEPDGLPELTPEEASKAYADLDKYKPVEWNEPDGLRVLTPEEKSKAYEDLDAYAAPFTASNEAIEAHANAQLDGTVRGETLASKVDTHSELPKYDDVDKYGPVQWNEPDGLRKLTPEEESKNYDDLHMYGPVQWNEPDGLPEPTAEELSKNYQDLAAYAASPQPDAATRIHPEEASKQYSDLSKYEQFENDGPSIPRIHPEQATKNYSDLDAYRSPNIDSIEEKYPVHPEEASKAYQDLNDYKPAYYNEPDGLPKVAQDPVNDGLSAFDKKAKDQSQVFTHLGSRSDYSIDATGEDAAGPLTAKAIRARMAQKTSNQPRQRTLDEEKASHDSKWDAIVAEAQEALGRPKHGNTSSLTGNFVRDFPEEFARSWSQKSTSSSLLPDDIEAASNGAQRASEVAEKEDFELSSMDESFPPANSRLEPAIERTTQTPTRPAGSFAPSDFTDYYSKAPQGLETSYEKECAGRSTWPTMVRHYKAADEGEGEIGSGNISSQAASAKGENGEGLYKVLAYDRTTQSVSVAEMTSQVLDGQQPRSPAEVMLNLTNPARFLPHFGPLHSQGYEVVSGSGDVLVFRKVRPGSPESAAEKSSHGPVNPIDLMGKPVMGNFASPTGFVNYETLTESDIHRPEPPFRSARNVREEEPAPIASRAEAKDRKRRRKRSFAKKVVVGGVWVVGIAYSVGVMAEYFSTGGLEGLGPRGL